MSTTKPYGAPVQIRATSARRPQHITKEIYLSALYPVPAWNYRDASRQSKSAKGKQASVGYHFYLVITKRIKQHACPAMAIQPSWRLFRLTPTYACMHPSRE